MLSRKVLRAIAARTDQALHTTEVQVAVVHHVPTVLLLPQDLPAVTGAARRQAAAVATAEAAVEAVIGAVVHLIQEVQEVQVVPVAVVPDLPAPHLLQAEDDKGLKHTINLQTLILLDN